MIGSLGWAVPRAAVSDPASWQADVAAAVAPSSSTTTDNTQTSAAVTLGDHQLSASLVMALVRLDRWPPPWRSRHALAKGMSEEQHRCDA